MCVNIGWETGYNLSLNKHDCNAEGKFSILSTYFHYHYLILQNKHMGTSVYMHPQMGFGEQ